MEKAQQKKQQAVVAVFVRLEGERKRENETETQGDLRFFTSAEGWHMLGGQQRK